MHPFFHHPKVRRARILFRWCRIFLWLMLFVALAAVSYLHLIGLPDFVKQPMLRRLRAEGVAAQFSNMQLGWGRGPSIIIENAAFSRPDQPLSPSLSAKRAELTLNWNALLHLQFEVRSLQVADAQLQIPVSETNGDALLLNKVALDLQFHPNDVMQINDCRGIFRGVQLDIIARVNHASDMRRWPFPAGGETTNRTFQARFQKVARTLQKIDFIGTPLLQIEAGADGRDMNSFHAELNFTAPAAQTPWGDVTNLVMQAACARLVDSGNEPFLKAKWSATSAATPWARGRKIFLSTTLLRGANSNLNVEVRLDASRCNVVLDSSGGNRFEAARLSWNGSALLASSNFMPLMAAGKLSAVEPQTPWGSAHEFSLECRAARAGNLPPPEAGWGPWATFAPWTLDWQAEIRDATHPKLRLDRLAVSGHWRAPQIVIENLQGELYGGKVKAAASLDIASRELRCNGKTDLDPNSIAQLFKPAASNWLAQFAWTTTPKVNARLRVVLPPWTNRPTGWAAAVGSSLQIDGDFAVGPAVFRQIPVLAGHSHVTYTNRTWNVSRLHAARPDGDIDLDYTAGPEGFRYVIDSHLDPKDALPLLTPGRQHILDELTFKQSPEIHAQIWGLWSAAHSLGFAGTVLATNFIARGEPVAAFRAGVGFTNLILTVHDLFVSNNECQVRAPWVQADLGAKMVRLTNVAGTLDPFLLQRVLRKKSPDFLRSLHFGAPPSVSAFGSFSYADPLATDLHFLVNGQGVHYNRLLADRAAGGVDWTGQTIAVTNIFASFFNTGTLMGWITFYSGPKHSTDLSADFTARDVDLPSLVSGITGKTNHLEGRLDGDLIFGGPNTSDVSNWHGQGRVHVHDALLWDIKVFGLLSPVLNLFSPGWGHSRAREAMADFVFTNGTLSSDDIEVRCTGFRMNVRGSVDKNKKINARLEAILSRETPVLGPVLSLAFTPLSKLFEYHISGPWNNPELEPVFVPRFIMFMLHPFKMFKSSPPPEPTPVPGDKK
jgi:hypothetical protein